MAHGKIEFHGNGIQFLGTWLLNMLLIAITLGLYTPWAFVSMQKWISKNTAVQGQQLTFKGSGAGFFGQYLLIAFLTVITFGIYGPWGFCRFMRWQTHNTYFADPGDNEV